MESQWPADIRGDVSVISSTALSPHARHWKAITLDLARRGAIAAKTVHPYGYSLHYLIAHLKPQHEGLIPLPLLYEHFHNHTPIAETAHNIGRTQFEEHLERWAGVAGYHVDPHTLIGARFRDTPLGAEARTAFIEGMIAASLD